MRLPAGCSVTCHALRVERVLVLIPMLVLHSLLRCTLLRYTRHRYRGGARWGENDDKGSCCSANVQNCYPHYARARAHCQPAPRASTPLRTLCNVPAFAQVAVLIAQPNLTKAFLNATVHPVLLNVAVLIAQSPGSHVVGEILANVVGTPRPHHRQAPLSSSNGRFLFNSATYTC